MRTGTAIVSVCGLLLLCFATASFGYKKQSSQVLAFHVRLQFGSELQPSLLVVTALCPLVRSAEVLSMLADRRRSIRRRALRL